MEVASALDAYEAYAPFYNAFNHQNDYEMWLGRALLPELERRGLSGRRALDVACGTGRAFAPLLRRGWHVRGCDISPSMLEWARREGGSEVEVGVADMRELPVLGEFDLVLSLNDSVSYLLDAEDLRRTLVRMRANLVEGGLVLFDLNSSWTYEEGSWAGGSKRTVEYGDRRWTWRAIGEVEPSIYEVRIEGDDVTTVVNRQRFRSQPEVLAAIAAAGLECRAVLGMEEVDGEVVLSEPPDEGRHYKVVYVAARAPTAESPSSQHPSETEEGR